MMRRFVAVCFLMCLFAFACAQPASAGWRHRLARWGYYPVTRATVVAAPAPCCQGTVSATPVQTQSVGQPTLAPAGH